MFESCHNWTVWEAVLSAAGYESIQSAWNPRVFEGERLHFAEAIFLLGILFLADVEVAVPTRNLTICVSHDEWLELSTGRKEEFDRYEAIFIRARLERWTPFRL